MQPDRLNPTELFKECLVHPEPFIDEAYCSDKLIISESSSSAPTPIMITNGEIIRRITAAEVALQDRQINTFEEQVAKIRNLLTRRDVNFLEFTSFWPSIDVSFSSYKNLSLSKQSDFLKAAIRTYIKKRHRTYTSHGYTATTIQVRKDFEKHKTSGSYGSTKVEYLLKKEGYTKYEGADFLAKRKVYCAADKKFGMGIIDFLKKRRGMKFTWQDTHQNKKPDLIFCGSSSNVYILELKHMKETGGGQDKQMAELISFIREGENDRRISYVAFLDGFYFNELISPSSGKIVNQRNQIIKYLDENKDNPNYFLNTFGLSRLIRVA